MQKTYQCAKSRRNPYTHWCLCKIIFSAIFIIATTIPTYATNISDSNKGCTSGNLTTSSGTAALEADWQANTVGVTFYNGDTQFDTGSCTYDGTLTLPDTDPTKTGYTFDGWKVKKLNILAVLNIQNDGYKSYGRGVYKNNDYCWAYGDGTINGGNVATCTNETGMNDVGLMEWKTKFNYGTIKGIASCNTTAGTDPWEYDDVLDEDVYTIKEGNILAGDALIGGEYSTDNNSGKYNCWCKVTGYDAGDSGIYVNVNTAHWVFSYHSQNSPVKCAGVCAGYCGLVAKGSYPEFRRAIFGQSQ